MRMAITPEHVSLQQIEHVCDKPIDALQLRRKKLASKAFYSFAKQCRRITQSKGILLIINDRFDIALSVKADGIHLPQRGLPPFAIKDFCPSNFLIGVSTHTDEEALEAQSNRASYITFSAQILGDSPNLVQLQKLANQMNIPILALGNIQGETISTYLQAGAQGYAAIRMFFS